MDVKNYIRTISSDFIQAFLFTNLDFYIIQMQSLVDTKGFLTFSGVQKCDTGLKWVKLLEIQKTLLLDFPDENLNLED